MRAAARVGLVVAGYVAAVLVALASVAVNAATTAGPDRQASSGMSAFSDTLLFLAVFGVAAVPPTGAALFFLRPYPSFWRGLAVVAVAIATTGIAAGFVCLAAQAADAGSGIQAWSFYALLRILAAPLFALAFLVGGVFSPHRRARIALGAATFSETVVFMCLIVSWLIRFRR